MRLVFIIDQVYNHGGIERVLSIKANYFAERAQVYIITTEQKNKKPCYSFSPKINFIDIGVDYSRDKSYFHPTNLFKLPNHILSIRKNINKINPDAVIVCSHSTDTYFLPFLLKKIPKAKEFHFSKFIEKAARENPKSMLKKYFLKFSDYVEKKYDRLVVLNQDEYNYYKSNNAVVIPNPLTFYPDSISNQTDNVVIAAGRIAHVKGLEHMINIWNLVFNKIKDWQLHIYGDGNSDYLTILKQKIKQNHLENQIFLKGPTDNIQEKMLKSSIYIMTSHNECLPLVLLEAQACGLPIVSFDCPHGPRNIIDNNTGVLIDLYDDDKFADSLVTLMHSREQRLLLGQQARENANRYQIDKIMKLWEDMFEEMTKSKH